VFNPLNSDAGQFQLELFTDAEFQKPYIFAGQSVITTANGQVWIIGGTEFEAPQVEAPLKTSESTPNPPTTTKADIPKIAKEVPSKSISVINLAEAKSLKAVVHHKLSFETALTGHSLFLDAAKEQILILTKEG
jgi:hypothetical protein